MALELSPVLRNGLFLTEQLKHGVISHRRDVKSQHHVPQYSEESTLGSTLGPLS